MAAAFADRRRLASGSPARARFVPPAVAFLPPSTEGEPAPYVEAPAPAWGGLEEPDEETEPEALTIIASAAEVEAASAPVDPWEQGAGTSTRTRPWHARERARRALRPVPPPPPLTCEGLLRRSLFTPYERGYIDECAAVLRADGFEVFVPHEHELAQSDTRPSGSSPRTWTGSVRRMRCSRCSTGRRSTTERRARSGSSTR